MRQILALASTAPPAKASTVWIGRRHGLLPSVAARRRLYVPKALGNEIFTMAPAGFHRAYSGIVASLYIPPKSFPMSDLCHTALGTTRSQGQIHSIIVRYNIEHKKVVASSATGRVTQGIYVGSSHQHLVHVAAILLTLLVQ
jgi:hypothetical protein